MADRSSTPASSIRPAEVRAAAVAEARAWLATPYRHQQSVRAVGCDCLGLVRGVWRSLYGPEPERAPAYSRDWAEASGRETLIEAFRRWLVEMPIAEAQAGDVVVFRMVHGSPAKHCGVLIESGQFVHAYEGVKRALISHLDEPAPGRTTWRRKLAAAFAFAEV